MAPLERDGTDNICGWHARVVMGRFLPAEIVNSHWLLGFRIQMEQHQDGGASDGEMEFFRDWN